MSSFKSTLYDATQQIGNIAPMMVQAYLTVGQRLTIISSTFYVCLEFISTLIYISFRYHENEMKYNETTKGEE